MKTVMKTDRQKRTDELLSLTNGVTNEYAILTRILKKENVGHTYYVPTIVRRIENVFNSDPA